MSLQREDALGDQQCHPGKHVDGRGVALPALLGPRTSVRPGPHGRSAAPAGRASWRGRRRPRPGSCPEDACTGRERPTARRSSRRTPSEPLGFHECDSEVDDERDRVRVRPDRRSARRWHPVPAEGRAVTGSVAVSATGAFQANSPGGEIGRADLCLGHDRRVPSTVAGTSSTTTSTVHDRIHPPSPASTGRRQRPAWPVSFRSRRLPVTRSPSWPPIRPRPARPTSTCATSTASRPRKPPRRSFTTGCWSCTRGGSTRGRRGVERRSRRPEPTRRRGRRADHRRSPYSWLNPVSRSTMRTVTTPLAASV